MFDKYWFYFLKETGFQKYQLDIWASINLELWKKEYVVFHKKRFFRKNTNELGKQMALLTESKDFNFDFDKVFFIYWLAYYQKNWKDAIIKWWDIDELELYQQLYNDFDLQLKLRKNLQIVWNYKTIEDIKNNAIYMDLNQAISFLLALATIYWNWNIVEENWELLLSNIEIRFPFDWSLVEYQEIIFQIEDILIKNWIYNKLSINKKQEFIWNIYDFDLLIIFAKSIQKVKALKDFFQVEWEIKTIFEKKLDTLKKQLDTDLRIKLDKFKLTEIEKVIKSY